MDIQDEIQIAIKAHEARYHADKSPPVDKPVKFLPDFIEFWRLWPGRYNKDNQKIWKVGKAKAAKIWVRLSAENREKIVILAHSGKIKAAGTEFLPDMWRWLRDQGWEDFFGKEEK